MDTAQDEPKAVHDAFLPPYTTFEDFSKELLGSIVAATKAANGIPKDHEYQFFESDAIFEERTASLRASLLSRVVEAASLERNDAHELLNNDMEDDDRMELVMSSCSAMLERVDSALDVVRNSAKAQEGQALDPSSTSITVERSTGAWNKTTTGLTVLHAQNVRRPQLRFQVPVDNALTPFKPKLVDKPNAKTPLDLTRRTVQDDLKDPAVDESIAAHLNQLGLDKTLEGPPEHFPHPYQHEIEAFEVPSCQLQAQPEQLYLPLDQVTCTYIDTYEPLKALAAKLESVSEFAVDLEAHSYRTFQGFTCLMQISTRDADFLIDTLALRDELRILNSSFTNPNILKVLHGADSDIMWLQRDHGLYIVNMFDTGQATRVLNMPRHALAWLLKHYCSVTANKQYQLADWRARPLQPELLRYAREDTHYLLYVYDRLRNELVSQGNDQANLLHAVYQRSRDLCLQRYEKPWYSVEQAQALLAKLGRSLPPSAQTLFLALHKWRDEVARDEDESPRYVLPDHMMLDLAARAPTEPTAILGCCQPIPPLIRLNVHVIKEIVEGTFTPTAATKASTDVSRFAKAAELSDYQGRNTSAVERKHRFDNQMVCKNKVDVANWLLGTTPSSAILSTDRSRRPYKGASKAAQVAALLATESIFAAIPDEALDALDHQRDLENRKQAKQTAMDQDADSAVPVAQPSDEIVVLSEVLEAEKEPKPARATVIDDDDDSTDPKPLRKKSKKVKRGKVSADVVVPHTYDSTTNEFDQQPQARPDDFDPYAGVNRKGKKGKGKKPQRGGKKSFSFRT